MKTPRNILVIVDPTVNVHPEIDKAALLARHCDASLRLFVCDTKAMREARLMAQQDETSYSQRAQDLPTMLEALAAPLRKRGLDVTTEIETAPVLREGLLTCTRCTDADLVIKETHHHSLLQRTFLTNTDWELIRHCPTPLLLTKPTPWYAAPTILAAVDPGHIDDKPAALDHAILELSVCLSRQLGGSLHVAHAFLPAEITALVADGVPAFPAAMTPTSLAREQAIQQQTLRALVQPHDIPESAVRIVLGAASERLPRLAGEVRADIMVLGAIARSKLERLLIGSTAERVLEHLPCDALIVKPPNFAAALPF